MVWPDLGLKEKDYFKKLIFNSFPAKKKLITWSSHPGMLKNRYAKNRVWMLDETHIEYWIKDSMLMSPKVQILICQIANTLGSGHGAYAFAASATSVAKCFQIKNWVMDPGPLCEDIRTLLIFHIFVLFSNYPLSERHYEISTTCFLKSMPFMWSSAISVKTQGPWARAHCGRVHI